MQVLSQGSENMNTHASELKCSAPVVSPTNPNKLQCVCKMMSVGTTYTQDPLRMGVKYILLLTLTETKDTNTTAALPFCLSECV